MSKILLSILKGTGENPFETVNLDRESRKYLHIQLNHYVVTYDSEGIEKRDKHIHHLVKCSHKYLNNAFEKSFMEKSEKLKTYWYCGEDENLFISGTFDSPIKKLDHAYLNYEIFKCSEETKIAGDPECESEANVREWLLHKKIQFNVLNDQIEFKSFDEKPIR